MSTLYPQYLMQNTDPPTKAAGDLALEMAKRSGPLRSRALSALGLLRDRAPEACSALTEEAVKEAAERLTTAYRDHPTAEIVRRISEGPPRKWAMRWTFALDGTLHLEDAPEAVNPEDRNPPPPGSPGEAGGTSPP